MNTETFKKRISFAYTQKGMLNKHFTGAISNIKIMAQGKQYHPFRWVKSKRHFGVSGESEANNTKLLCKALGLELMWGNDAPRGGIEGNFMYLSKKDIAKLKDVDFELIK